MSTTGDNDVLSNDKQNPVKFTNNSSTHRMHTSSYINSIPSESSEDEDDTTKVIRRRTFLVGGKHTLDQPPADRAVHVHAFRVLVNNVGPILEVELRLHDFLVDVRKIMDTSKSGNDQIPAFFRFCYEDGVPVDTENEGNTHLKSCLDEQGRLCVFSLKMINSSRPYLIHVSQSCRSQMTPGADLVVGCCLRLLETFETEQHTANIADLPDPLDSCTGFFRNTARAAKSCHGCSRADSWRLIEMRLESIEKTLRVFLKRDKFVALMSYHFDMDALSSDIEAIQKELQANSTIPTDHPVYFVRIDRPNQVSEALLHTLSRTNFLDLCSENHAKTRRGIAGFLDMDEIEIISKIKAKGVPNILEAGVFRDVVQPEISASAYSSIRDWEKIKDILAPHIDSQEALITKKARSFNPKTCNWAIEKFDAWASDIDSDHKCFLLVGPAASGKTTLMSHIVSERRDVVMASHYCRHDDVTTKDPKVMILSIAYQLCRQSVSFETEIRGFLVDQKMSRKQLLSANYPIASLFRDFLDGPLRSIEVSPGHQYYIVIEGIELGSQLRSDKNPITKTIRTYLSYLAPWMRLVLTTRPVVKILKQLRSFKPNLVEPNEDDTMADFSNFFYDVLANAAHGDKSTRRAIADQLASNAHGNYVYASILKEKAYLAQRTNDPSAFVPYIDLNFEQAFERDLALATTTGEELFWKLVRLSLVAFRALDKSEIVTLTGCTMSELEDTLARARTFFLITDTSVIRFGQKLIKRWLLARISHQTTGVHQVDDGTTSIASIMAQYSVELQSCHVLFSRYIIDVLEHCRLGNHFNLDSDATREYAILYGVRHMVHAGMVDEARAMLFDTAILIVKTPNCGGIIEDLDVISEDDEFVALVQRAISLSKEAIKNDPRQIVSQLIGRLKAVASKTNVVTTLQLQITAFVERLENHDYGFDWWCPVVQSWDRPEGSLVKRLEGHNGQVQGVHMNKNGRQCVSACWDGDVRVWDIATGKCEVVFSGHRSAVWCVQWDHEGNQIVSGGVDKTVRIWNYKSREPICVLRGHEGCIFSVKFSQDSLLVASGSKDGTIRIWNVVTGVCRQTLCGHEGFVYSVDWKPNADNQYICSGGTDNAVRVWDINESSCIRVLHGHRDWVRSCCWSVNGLNIFSGSSDQTVVCWDVELGECQQVLLGAKGGIWSVSQSSDGRYVLSGSADETIKIWECSSWRCYQTLSGHEGSVLDLSISADGSTVISGGADNSLIVWDCEVERTTSDMDGHDKPIWDVDMSADSKYIVSASSDHTARLWSVTTNLVERVFTGHSGPVCAAKFSHNSRHVATASSDTTSAIYQISTGERKWTFSHSDAVIDVVWSKDDKVLFTACRDRVIRRWDLLTGLCAACYQGHTNDIKGLSLSPSGLRLASASLDATLRVWKISSCKSERVLQKKEDSALSVVWVDDTLLTAGYTSGCVRLWNADTGERLTGFLPGHHGPTNAVSCSPDGSHIVSASADKELRIWDIKSAQCERIIEANTGLGVFCVKWTPDRRYILSGGSDRRIRMWQAETGLCKSVFLGKDRKGIYEVSWAPSGKYVASGSCDRTVQIWDAESGECVQTFKGHTNWVHAIDWEQGERRVLSRSDDGTSRVWNIESGVCEKVHDDALIPDGFVIGSVITTTLNSRDQEVVGIQCQNVRVYGERCCGRIGEKMYFFELKKSHDIKKSLN